MWLHEGMNLAGNKAWSGIRVSREASTPEEGGEAAHRTVNTCCCRVIGHGAAKV